MPAITVKIGVGSDRGSSARTVVTKPVVKYNANIKILGKIKVIKPNGLILGLLKHNFRMAVHFT